MKYLTQEKLNRYLHYDQLPLLPLIKDPSAPLYVYLRRQDEVGIPFEEVLDVLVQAIVRTENCYPLKIFRDISDVWYYREKILSLRGRGRSNRLWLCEDDVPKSPWAPGYPPILLFSDDADKVRRFLFSSIYVHKILTYENVEAVEYPMDTMNIDFVAEIPHYLNNYADIWKQIENPT